MILQKVIYDTNTNSVLCEVEFTEGEYTRMTYVLTDAELTVISPNWWLPEIKQLLTIKLSQGFE